MTNKAQKILQRMNKRKALKRWREFSNPERREKVLAEFNRDQMDDVGPLGGDQGIAVLKEMNDLEVGHDEVVKSLAPRADVM
jgi:uncharacterized protein YfeS